MMIMEDKLAELRAIDGVEIIWWDSEEEKIIISRYSSYFRLYFRNPAYEWKSVLVDEFTVAQHILK